jgi:hypothetical protein
MYMPLCCDFSAQRHDGQLGCTATTTTSKEKAIMLDKVKHRLIIVYVW